MTVTEPDVKSLSDEQINDKVKASYQSAACLIGIHVEARIRMHEASHHGIGDEDECRKILADSGKSILEFFESLAPRL